MKKFKFIIFFISCFATGIICGEITRNINMPWGVVIMILMAILVAKVNTNLFKKN